MFLKVSWPNELRATSLARLLMTDSPDRLITLQSIAETKEPDVGLKCRFSRRSQARELFPGEVVND